MVRASLSTSSIASASLALALVVAVLLAAGCGSSGGDGSTSTAEPTKVRIARAWAAKGGCTLPAGTSRGACTVAGYRCLSVRVDRGVTVSCARPGHSLSFLAKRSYNGQRPPT